MRKNWSISADALRLNMQINSLIKLNCSWFNVTEWDGSDFKQPGGLWEEAV